MASEITVLAFDTSAAHCAAALLSGDRIRALRAEEMARGQAERLVPLLEEVLDEAGARWGDLDRLGVGIGPGNFTGLRIAVACARGLALGLGRPAIGVSTFDAIAAAPKALPAIPAPRGQVYIRRPDAAPELVPGDSLTEPLAWPPAPAELALRIARIARDHAPGAAPAPLYLRPADAAPARDRPPRILP
ncbi:tRNA (adenosine(37)-N6)-threonylcarbamoyltransferase complex dimerization subunit type 1 TsaB [Roseivivax sp. CAU 1761]